MASTKMLWSILSNSRIFSNKRINIIFWQRATEIKTLEVKLNLKHPHMNNKL